MLTSCSAPMYLVTSKSFALGWCTIHWNKYWNFGNFFLYNSLGLNSEYPKKHIKRVEQIFSTFLLQDKFQRKTSFPCFSTWQPESCVSASVCLSSACEQNERKIVCEWVREGKMRCLHEREMKCACERKKEEKRWRWSACVTERKRGVCLRVWGRKRKREGERERERSDIKSKVEMGMWIIFLLPFSRFMQKYLFLPLAGFSDKEKKILSIEVNTFISDIDAIWKKNIVVGNLCEV